MINRSRFAEPFPRAPENVEIRQRRLDHNNIGAFIDIEPDFAQRFIGIGRIHLVGTAIAKLRRTFGGIAKRAVKDGSKLRRVTHDARVGEAAGIERFANRADAAVHHVARRDHVRAILRVRERGLH